MVTSTPCRNASTSNCPLEFTNFIRFSEARLHAVSSRNMYSEQGLLALIRAVLLHVCQRLNASNPCSEYMFLDDTACNLEHVLGAGVTCIDPRRALARMPAVDRRIVLHAGIPAMPGRIRDPSQQLARAVFLVR